MKKIILSLMFSLLTLSVVGCSETSDNRHVTDDNDVDNESVPDKEVVPNKEEIANSQEEALKAIKGHIETDLDINLPKSLPLSKGDHLTAITKSDKDSYSVLFFKSDKFIAINDDQLINGSESTEKIARLEVEKFDSQATSDEKVAFEDFSGLGGDKIDLGHDITGYKDVGAGSVFTGWNQGPWSLTTRSITLDDDEEVELAKEAIEFLESHTLPIPNQYGNAHLDVHRSANLTIWQDKLVVYTLDNIKYPMDMLKILVEFE